jgi:hypothetical protein
MKDENGIWRISSFLIEEPMYEKIVSNYNYFLLTTSVLSADFLYHHMLFEKGQFFIIGGRR